MAEEGSREPEFALDPPGSAKQDESVINFLPDEDSFRALIENGTDVISIHGADGVMTYQSPSVKKILGYEQNELLGQQVFGFLHPDEADGLGEAYARLLAEPNASVRAKASFRHKDGSWRLFDVTGQNLLDNPAIRGLVFNARDITEISLAEEERAHSLSLLRATLESTTDGILVVDLQGNVTSYNRKFVEMWRIPEHVIKSGKDQEALAFVLEQVKDPMGLIAKVRQLYDRPRAESSDVIEFRDGRVFERYSQPQVVGDETVGRVWSFRDITGRRALEEQLRQSQKMEAIGQLAGGIAHDFNNLLTAITGYGELSLKYVTEDGPLRRHLLEIQKAGGRAASLTRQLLAFSRKQLLQPKPLNLNEVVSEMERMFHRLIGENIELRTLLAPDLRTIVADASQIEQVILNLIVNARDAMPGGGHLVIETANLTLAQEIVDARFSIPPGDYVMLAVSDTGQGMTEETREKIFEPFFSTKEQGKGTGLGLSTVYGIVKQSGGYIRVESEINRGASFKIFLPCATDGNSAEEAAQPASPQRGTETLLLVEDEELVRKLTREILELSGYHVLEARHGMEAINVNRSHAGPIDLLLTDMVMPGMGGRELAAEISAVRPDIKIILMSGYTESGILDEGSTPSGVWFVEKPFSPDVLLLRVREALDDIRAGE